VAEERHHERFAEAVERKKQDAKEASERTSDAPTGGSQVEGDQPDLTSPARPQDEYSTRAKGTQHKKVTADKWNQ
jgi:hypothetical protein